MLHFSGVVVVMGKYLISAHLSKIFHCCGLQIWVSGFWQHKDPMDGKWLSTKSTLSNLLEWLKLGRDKPTQSKFNSKFGITEQ
jgi:hypothetical protein